jgi:Peptidase A4 family
VNRVSKASVIGGVATIAFLSAPGLVGRAAAGGVSLADIPTNSSSTAFAGYVTRPAGLSKVSGVFTIPKVTCGASDQGIAPGIFLAGTSVFSGVGTLAVCHSGVASYTVAIIINNIESHVLSISGGDKVKGSVTETASKTSVSFKDLTTGASKSATGSGGGVTEALLIDDSVLVNHVQVPVPTFRTNAFTSCLVGTAALGSTSPVAYNMKTSGGVLQVVTSALTGGNAFIETFKHH